MATRFRCSGCGNLTRFDVEATRRTREYHHYTVGGELDIEETEVVDEHIDAVTCRWCAATGDTIERIDAGIGADFDGPEAATNSDASAPTTR